MKTSHTPGPWSVNEARKNEWYISSPDIDIARMLHNGKPHPDGTKGMHKAMAANAEFIVRACNVHYELIAALEELLIDSAAHINVPINECVAGPLGRARAALDKARVKL